MSAKGKSVGIGGSQLILIIVVLLVAGFAIYYVVVPVLYPPAPPGSAISLTPSTNIGGSPVTITGKGLAHSVNVTATFRGNPVSLTGTCETDSSGNLAGCSFIVPSGLASGAYTVAVNDGNKISKATFSVPTILPPESTFIVSITSIALAVVTQLVTRRVVDLKAERKMRAEITQYQSELRDAMRTKDKAKEEKLKKKQAAINQMNAKVSTARLRVTAITFVPFIVLYYVMAGFLGGFSVTVANSPIPIPYLVSAQGTMPLFWWYSISSLTFSPMLTKIFGTST